MRRLAVVLAVLAIAGGLAACGGDDGDGASASGGGGGGDKDRFCELADQEDIEDFDPASTGDMEQLDEALSDLSAAAPGEIKDDVETVASGLRELVEVLSTIDTSDPAAREELAERAEELEGMQEQMEVATGRVDRYLEEECGIDPEA